MKKFIKSLILLSSVTNFLFFSCAQPTDVKAPSSVDNVTYDAVMEIGSEPVEFNGIRSYIVSRDTQEVNLTNVQGKHIYFARGNFAETTSTSTPCIPKNDLSFVTSASGVVPKSAVPPRTNPSGAQLTKEDIVVYGEGAEPTTRNFNIKDDDTQQINQFNFTAMAVRDNVIVWRQSEEVDGSKVTTKVTQEMCEAYADKFEEMLPYETELFGAKSDRIFLNNYGSSDYIKYYTDLANFTNIIIFDMEKVASMNGVLGFFYRVDYWLFYEGNNIGNNLYINDSAIYGDENDLRDENGIIWDAYNTMAHEYMHSLQYARKAIEQAQYNWNSAFGEMLGQLCEFVLGARMGVPAKAGVINFRFKTLVERYYTSGLLDFNTSVNSNYPDGGASYPVTIAFGIFLLQNYGGEALLSHMLINRYDGWDAIINGIRSACNIAVTKQDILGHFMEAYFCKGSDFYENMKNDLEFHARGETLTVKGVDPYDLSWNGYFDQADWTDDGLKLFPWESEKTDQMFSNSGTIQLRPEGGFQVCDVGIASDDSVRIEFGNADETGRHQDEVLYILIGD